MLASWLRESPSQAFLWQECDLFSRAMWGTGLGGGGTPRALCRGFLSCKYVPRGSARSPAMPPGGIGVAGGRVSQYRDCLAGPGSTVHMGSPSPWTARTRGKARREPHQPELQSS